MKCKICGKEFKQLRRHILKSHADFTYKKYYDTYLKTADDGVCCICGNETRWNETHYDKCCTDVCLNKYVKQQSEITMLKKYGVKNPGQVDEFRNKAKQTYLEKTGYDNPSKNPNVIERIKEHTDYEAIGEKSKIYWAGLTADEKHDLVMKNKQTKLINHNNANWNNRDSARKTCLKKYGCEHPAQAAQVKTKITEKLKGRTATDECRTNIKFARASSINKKFKELDKNFISYSNGYTKWHCDKCNKDIDIRHCLYYQRLHNKLNVCTICNPIGETASIAENTLYDSISNMYTGELIQGDRNVLDGLELDIYIPEKKLAIEFDGLYWHDERHKDHDYHVNKTNSCEAKGIQLIHIFEDEWIDKNEIVLSRLKSLIGISNRIFARKTICKEITYTESKEFLEKNHIQGNCTSKYRYGLFYNDDLVSVMTFGESRFKKGEFELLRFANKLNTNVIGGASKLFDHFVNDHPAIDKIVSFADRRWSKGNLYERLNFLKTDVIKPSYFYILPDGRHNRIEFQKHKLIADGYAADKTEHEIMIERGIYRIYDCGNLKYEWRRNGNQ